MRIDLGNTSDIVETGAARSQGATAGSRTGDGSATSQTAIQSQPQIIVSALAARAAGLPEVRQEKVAALARLINQGQYQPSPAQTAESILSEITLGSAA